MKFKKRDNCYYLYTKNKTNYEDSNWIIFYFRNVFDISYEVCGYFDNRPRINIDLIFFSLTFILPFRNKWTDECDPPKYGISIHNNTFWIYLGGEGNMKGGNKWWTWNIPFVTKDWVRTSILLNDGTWEHETQGNRKSFYEDKWKEKQKKWQYDFIDSYDGEIIPTTIYVDEREWRPKGLKFTSLFALTVRSIDIHFSKECGSRKGSYKGGTLQTGYALLKNEDPIDCIKRFQKDRNM